MPRLFLKYWRHEQTLLILFGETILGNGFGGTYSTYCSTTNGLSTACSSIGASALTGAPIKTRAKINAVKNFLIGNVNCYAFANHAIAQPNANTPRMTEPTLATPNSPNPVKPTKAMPKILVIMF